MDLWSTYKDMSLPNIPEWLKISSVHFLAITIATGALIFGPGYLITSLGLIGFVKAFRMWIGFVFLISLSILLARMGANIFEFAKKRIKQSRTLKQWQKRLHNLTPDECEVLAGYINNNTRTQYFQPENGVIQGLAAENIIKPAASVGNVISGFAYNIQPWAWKYLKNNPELLGELVHSDNKEAC